MHPTLFQGYTPGYSIYRVRLKNDPTRKMRLLGNALKFLRQIWYDGLAGFCSLMC